MLIYDRSEIFVEQVFDVNEALEILKDKIILKDNSNNRFVCRKNKIYVYSSNSSYCLKFNEFLDIFKNNKFIIEDFDENSIDPLKDKEYYSFKHK